MKIYTGFGDEGKTALFGGEVVSKSHLRVELYGTLDELNSIIGILKIKISDSGSVSLLEQIQKDLFVLSAEIATPDEAKRKHFDHHIMEKDVRRLEREIDRMDEKLPQLRNFILPGGGEAAAFSHLARTVCRRAERIFTLLYGNAEVRKTLGVYLNRLSDLFFVLGRFQNQIEGVQDVMWEGISRDKTKKGPV